MDVKRACVFIVNELLLIVHCQAIKDLVETWNWKSFTIVYENDDGLIRLNELLKLYDPKGYTVTIRQLEPGDNNR
jgi:glutamate receptor, ionotropic, invertebrate